MREITKPSPMFHVNVAISYDDFDGFLEAFGKLKDPITEDHKESLFRQTAKKENIKYIKVLFENGLLPSDDFIWSSTCYSSSTCLELLLELYPEYYEHYDGFYSPLIGAILFNREDNIELLQKRGFAIRHENFSIDEYLRFFSHVNKHFEHSPIDDEYIDIAVLLTKHFPFTKDTFKGVSQEKLNIARKLLGEKNWINEKSNLYEEMFKKGIEKALLLHRKTPKTRTSYLKRYLQKRERDLHRGKPRKMTFKPMEEISIKKKGVYLTSGKSESMLAYNPHFYDDSDPSASKYELFETFAFGRPIVTKIFIADQCVEGKLSLADTIDLLVAHVANGNNEQEILEATGINYSTDLAVEKHEVFESPIIKGLYRTSRIEGDPVRVLSKVVDLLKITDKDIKVLIEPTTNFHGYTLVGPNGIREKFIAFDSTILTKKEPKQPETIIQDYDFKKHGDLTKGKRFQSVSFMGLELDEISNDWISVMGIIMEHALFMYGDIVLDKAITLGTVDFNSHIGDIKGSSYNGVRHKYILALKQMCFVINANLTLNVLDHQDKQVTKVVLDGESLSKDEALLANKELCELKRKFDNTERRPLE